MSRPVAALIGCLLLCVSARAEHLPGGTIAYRCLGGNMYEITLAIPRDCAGTEVLPQSLKFTNNCGVNFTVQSIPYSEVIDHHPVCPAQAGQTTCDGGTHMGLRTYLFRHTLYLSPCSNWRISWDVCCRPPALNLIGNPGVYVEAVLHNAGGVCNDSPVFLENALPFACVGQPLHYDPFVVETEGDSLAFALIDARYAAPAPTTVFYQPGHNGASPYPTITFDPATGAIDFTPDQAGQVVVVVRATEYRNGVVIGSAMRDFTFTVTACDNTVPAIDAGALTVLEGDVQLNGPRHFTVCGDAPGSVRAVFTDPNNAQELTLWSDLTDILPGATMTVTGTNPAEATISWNTLPEGSFHFGIKALDDNCLYRGLQTYTYTVAVHTTPTPVPPGSATFCPAHPPMALADSLSAPLPAGGTWTGPSGTPHSGTFDPANDPPGLYTYSLDTPVCPWSATVLVVLRLPDDPLCLGVGITEASPAAPRAWPNPAYDRIHLHGPPTAATTYDVLDLHGRVRATLHGALGDAPRTLLLPPDLPAGTYLLRANDATHLPLRFVITR